MRTTTLILFVVACFQASIQQNCDQEVLSIVMVMDASGSVGISDFNLARDATVEMIKQMDVNPNKVHVGYVVYDTKVQVFSTLVSNDQHKQQLIGTIGNINYLNFGGGTATGTALDMAHKLFGAISRPFVPKIVVLFTDGYSNSGLAVNPAADALKRDGIDIFAVGVTPFVNDVELNYVSSEPKSKYLLQLSDYQQLYSLINGITQTMCGASAFIEPGQKAEIESPQNQKRNFQTDLTKLRSQSSARASMILIDLDIHEGLPILSHSFDNPFTSRTDMVLAKPARERINPDNSRTITYYAFPGPNDKRLYYSVVASAPGNNRYDLSIRAL